MTSVGVVGCGLMGSGIAESVARAGYTTIVREVDEARLTAGRERLRRSLETAVSRGKIPAIDGEAAHARLQFTTSLADLADCDVVIEAATENLDVKLPLFRELDQRCKPATILASNTSSIPIIRLAAATRRRDRVLGLHFFNPVPVMPLVEVIRTIATSNETVAKALSLGAALGKKAIQAQDRAGFIVNTLLIPYLLDAARMLENGHATREDIDEGMRLGCGHPMGPLRLLDFVGIDTACFIAEIMYAELNDPRYAAPPLLRQMNIAGLHGRKAGRGFYEYGA
ncbi:MAG: 3-hydroxybutyryl-CoA dehydrogenase [Chloroflexota bacterium]